MSKRKIKTIKPGPKAKIRATMQRAYCSYLSCPNEDVYRKVIVGTCCPSCKKPLSNSGMEKIKTERTKNEETGKLQGGDYYSKQRKPLKKVTK